jgi:predicted TPR repeat methyltransferase
MSATISTSASSSGDLRADRRFLYAEESAATGDHSAAAELLEQFLEIVPYWAPALFALGVAREKLGDADAAKQAYARALACDPQDVLGASLALARLGAAPVPASATPAYVVRLFDQYARRFDAHLVEGLGYRAPALLRDAVADVRRRMARPMHFARALDLGCGTGLAGGLPRLRRSSRRPRPLRRNDRRGARRAFMMSWRSATSSITCALPRIAP